MAWSGWNNAGWGYGYGQNGQNNYGNRGSAEKMCAHPSCGRLGGNILWPYKPGPLSRIQDLANILQFTVFRQGGILIDMPAEFLNSKR